MNYFTNIPDEILNKILLNLDYKSLVKTNLINKNIKNHYTLNKKYIHRSLIKNYGYTLVENSTSFNFQKPNYTLSITKNINICPQKLLEGYLSVL